MLAIKNFCIGDGKKSFYIDNFTDGINIIHSDDNNKGKTIVSQGIMFALGNIPSFPSGFETFKDFYYFVTLLKDNEEILICRKNDYFIINDGNIKVYDSVNAFKRYFNDKISFLPLINKNGSISPSGLELFIEMVFLPQDGRNTSNIFNKGRYSKEDFYEFIYSYMKCSKFIDPQEIEKIKLQIKQLEEDRKVLLKSNSILKSKNMVAAFSHYTVSKNVIDEKLKQVEKIKTEISDIKSQINRIHTKRIKTELLIKEISSLNRELEQGKLRCADCGSDKITYEADKSGVVFDITDLDTRNQIKEILNTKIQILNEDLEELNVKLSNKQIDLRKLLSDDDVSTENLLFYKKSIVESSQNDEKILNIDNEIKKLNGKLKDTSNEILNESNSKELVHKNFVQYMQEFYNFIEPQDNLSITDLFTKRTINYSGSQGAIFLMARLYASSKLMNLEFPLYVDDFRDGELSTEKEERVIEKFKDLNKQIILTCTLKDEEKSKYNYLKDVNEISFDFVTKFNLLTEKYNDVFYTFMKKIKISTTFNI